MIDGFTGDQRFFLGFAQVWRAKLRDSALRQQVLSNAHSPAEFARHRRDAQSTPGTTAFDVKPGDKYYLPPDKRVHLW